MHIRNHLVSYAYYNFSQTSLNFFLFNICVIFYGSFWKIHFEKTIFITNKYTVNSNLEDWNIRVFIVFVLLRKIFSFLKSLLFAPESSNFVFPELIISSPVSLLYSWNWNVGRFVKFSFQHLFKRLYIIYVSFSPAHLFFLYVLPLSPQFYSTFLIFWLSWILACLSKISHLYKQIANPKLCCVLLQIFPSAVSIINRQNTLSLKLKIAEIVLVSLFAYTWYWTGLKFCWF